MSHAVTAAPRSSGLCRGVAALSVALFATASGVLAAPARAAADAPASEPLVVLLRDHIARTRPSVRAHRIEPVAARRPLTRVRTVLPVLAHETSRDGRSWVRVRLPGRPSGHTGWIPATHTRMKTTVWRLAVRLATRRVTVYRDGRVARSFRAVVGAPSTPSPRGRFFIEEAVALSPADHGGPFALATSARSNVLQEFDGGPGQIALHGTAGLSGALGTASSHGCIRLSADAITWLARRIGGGVPIRITS
ncbi:MAG: L,D-transpeptidase [Solirubrobacteraceae bacterium]